MAADTDSCNAKFLLQPSFLSPSGEKAPPKRASITVGFFLLGSLASVRSSEAAVVSAAEDADDCGLQGYFFMSLPISWNALSFAPEGKDTRSLNLGSMAAAITGISPPRSSPQSNLNQRLTSSQTADLN